MIGSFYDRTTGLYFPRGFSQSIWWRMFDATMIWNKITWMVELVRFCVYQNWRKSMVSSRMSNPTFRDTLCELIIVSSRMMMSTFSVFMIWGGASFWLGITGLTCISCRGLLWLVTAKTLAIDWSPSDCCSCYTLGCYWRRSHVLDGFWRGSISFCS